ncbi:ABC transporter permease [Streptomyces candidus]|uniref:ABC-2 type transport system permease protein n=1 Tax=Streptomyces candidus TaxID=67283 RepID=A0A7X0HHC7_9ACTN|nr:ABC transporter permease [Streptomyces candidus]MBB6437615.1 ABC-2 type transport system permease protein [Streptomyces candidus]GHH53606.1 ABC transporter [Streptomyces candidus]
MHAGYVWKSEWTKIRSVRSTGTTLALAAVFTIGLGFLISALSKNEFAKMDAHELRFADPTFISFVGTSLGQLAMIVFGVMVVGGEYSTGMIRTSLAAVPRRGLFLFSKIAVATLLAFVVALVTSFVTFFVGQAALGPYKASLGDPGVLRAVIGAALYMTLIAVFAMGVTTVLRSPMLSLGILMPLFFLLTPILGNVPATRKVAQYLPDQAGGKVMQVVAPEGDIAPYGPWGGFGIMVLWVLAALCCGWLVLKKRDA